MGSTLQDHLLIQEYHHPNQHLASVKRMLLGVRKDGFEDEGPHQRMHSVLHGCPRVKMPPGTNRRVNGERGVRHSGRHDAGRGEKLSIFTYLMRTGTYRRTPARTRIPSTLKSASALYCD